MILTQYLLALTIVLAHQPPTNLASASADIDLRLIGSITSTRVGAAYTPRFVGSFGCSGFMLSLGDGRYLSRLTVRPTLRLVGAGMFYGGRVCRMVWEGKQVF